MNQFVKLGLLLIVLQSNILNAGGSGSNDSPNP